MNDAPPDAGLLADALEMLERLPRSNAVDEVIHLLESRPSVVAERRRARALRYALALHDFGDFRSVRALAFRVAREFQMSPETIRPWVSRAVESTNGVSDDAGTKGDTQHAETATAQDGRRVRGESQAPLRAAPRARRS